MNKFKYPGFDKLEENSVLFHSLPLCDILYSFLGESDFSYICTARFPIELTELILHYLEYKKNDDRETIGKFAKEYLTEDSLCPVDKLLTFWGDEKFNRMISDLQRLYNN